MLLTLLIVSNPDLIFTLIKELLPYAGILFSGWVYWKNMNREIDKAAFDDLKKLKSEVANHGLMFTASEQVREHLVDKNNIRIENLENRVNYVDSTNIQVLNKVQQLEIKQEMINATIYRLETTVNELKVDSKEQNKEILDLIKIIAKK